MKTMGRAGFVDLIGEENLRANIDDAIAHATELIEACLLYTSDAADEL